MKDHIDLSEPCVLGTMTQWSYHGESRPGLHRCHCCDNDTTKDQVCLNPKHWFYGTPSENAKMRSLEARQAGGKAGKGRTQCQDWVDKRTDKLRGKVRSSEQRDRMSKAAKTRKPSQNGPTKGVCCWITNGTENLYQLTSDSIPNGWRRGRTLTWKTK